MNNCVFDESCPNPHYARGLCRPHYSRNAYHGTLDDVALPPKHTTIQHRLTNKNLELKVADCAVCGPDTPINLQVSRNKWRCAIKNKSFRVYKFSQDGTVPVNEARQARESFKNLQGGLCAIEGCEEPATHLDHCHDTGKLRGLLCLKCNTGLGMFSDSVEKLKAAIDYLNQ